MKQATKVLKVEKNIPMPGDIAEVRAVVDDCKKLKVGDSFLIDYMRWNRISVKIILAMKLEGIALSSRRQKGKLVKKTRVWRLN